MKWYYNENNKNELIDLGGINKLGYMFLVILLFIYIGGTNTNLETWLPVFFILVPLIFGRLINRFIKTLLYQTIFRYIFVFVFAFPFLEEYLGGETLSYFLTIFIVFAILGYINKYIRGRSKSK